MRLYSFVNYYLSPLQHGLQTAHCVSEMSLLNGSLRATFEEWAVNHKTIIICNGGNTAQLEDLFTKLIDLAGPDHPLVKFYEDEQSLNCALTSVAIILPEWVYNATFIQDASGCDTWVWNHELTADHTPSMYFSAGTDGFRLINLIKSHRLA